MDYRRLLDGLSAELEANEAIVLEDYYLNRGLKPKAARATAARHGLKLGDGLLEFFTQVNGGVIQWRFNPKAAGRLELRQPNDASVISGFAAFYMLDELLQAHTGLHGTPFEEGLEDKTRLAAFRPLDKNVEEALAGFEVENGVLVDRMVYLRQYEDLVDLGVDLSGYLQALVQAKAFIWWQDVFAARPAGKVVADLYYYIPLLFEAEKLNAFRER